MVPGQRTASLRIARLQSDAVRSARLSERIRAEIASSGSIGFARFMELALYDPEYGYYTSGTVGFGREGDFITAPELTPLFARCLARQCAEVLQRLGGGEILEVGAGSGVLACALLGELERLGHLPLRYRIVELSPALREHQRSILQQAPVPLSWLDSLPNEPYSGLVLANELLDAMPCHRVQMHAGRFHELRVQYQQECFQWLLGGPFSPADELLPLGPFAEGYITELNLAIEPWVQHVSSWLRRGLVLCVDYGYPRTEYLHPQRVMGTLLCHRNHTASANPLLEPGSLDISASVDFSRLAEAGEHAGLELCGYASQAGFLLGTAAALLSEDAAAHMLLLPGGLGERFQVMALGRGISPPLCGFSMQDYRWRL